mgnify:CR=1 FL=1
MALSEFSVLSSVLCEEVRQEANGQAIIIGAMTNGPNVSDDDDTRVNRLALYLEVQMPSERIDLHIRLVKCDAEEPVLYADVDTTKMYDSMPEPEKWFKNPIAIVVMSRESFSMKGSGDYHLQYATEEGKWEDHRVFYFPPEDTNEE